MNEFMEINDCFANRFALIDEKEIEAFGVDWSCEKGFGRLEILCENGKIFISTEYMGKDFAKRVLNALVDMAELSD